MKGRRREGKGRMEGEEEDLKKKGKGKLTGQKMEGRKEMAEQME